MFEPFCYQPHQEKHVHQSPEGVKDYAEGSEYNDLEEANIGKMDNLLETESEASDKEADNYKCSFCQKMYIDKTELIKHMELCDVEENKESEEDRENILSLLPGTLQQQQRSIEAH